MGEEGGDNLYAAVQNDVINTFDPLGLDFIAVADRAVEGLGGSAYHYSLQYYESICNPPKGVEMSVSDFLAQNPKARKKGSFELLSDGGWEVWVLRRRGLSPVQTWGVEKVSVSVIHYSDRSDSFASVFSSPNPLVVAYRWAEAMGYAKGYEYAEQEGFAGKFNKWPNSKYQFPGDHPFNNSNTFIRYIVSRLGVRMYELKGAHPGRNSPKAVANLYGKHKPWPAGNIPPSPY